VNRAAKGCARPGCFRRVPRDKKHCSKCARRFRFVIAAEDKKRPTATQRGYDHEWKVIRDKYLAKHPRCEGYGDRRKDHAKASMVDHIIPLKDGGTNAFSNLQAMCRNCHGAKTNVEDGGFGNPRKAAKPKASVTGTKKSRAAAEEVKSAEVADVLDIMSFSDD